jgi:hypothetical protein
MYLTMDAPEPPKPFMKRLQERLAASRFFTFSLLLHVVLVIMGGSVVLIKSAMDAPDFEASEGGLVAGAEVAAPPPETPPDLTQTFTPDTPQVSAPTLNAISTTNISTPTFAVQQSAPVVKPVQSDAMSKALENASKAMAKGAGVGNIPGTMAGRMGGTSRQRMMDMNKGKKKSEEAVMRGLRWLMKNQSENGSWAGGNKSAMTGLAILCFLGHGETTTSPEFGATVQKGVEWLIKQGTEGQGKLSTGKTLSGGPPVYEHAIAAYALGEYYTMTKDERVAPILKQAVDYIVKGQGTDGGWVYGYAKGENGDTSVSGWQIQALKAAHLSQLNIEGVDAALDKAMLNLKRVQGPKGGFGYREAGDKYSLTGVGVLCTYFWKQNKDELVRDGIKFILDKANPEVDYKGPKADLYAWYYNTQACLMYGGDAWNKWNRMFQDQIADSQSPEGSWPPCAGGVGDLQKRPDGDGPYYRTTLCILMLEVYYRYMPVTKG